MIRNCSPILRAHPCSSSIFLLGAPLASLGSGYYGLRFASVLRSPCSLRTGFASLATLRIPGALRTGGFPACNTKHRCDALFPAKTNNLEYRRLTKKHAVRRRNTAAAYKQRRSNIHVAIPLKEKNTYAHWSLRKEMAHGDVSCRR